MQFNIGWVDFGIHYKITMSRFNHPMHDIIAQNCEPLGRATAQAKLYSVEWYPGMVLSDDASHKVIGELYAINNKSDLIDALDEYEGCSDEQDKPHDFMRATCLVEQKDSDGQLKQTEALVYLYQSPTEELTQIESGDFYQFSMSNWT